MDFFLYSLEHCFTEKYFKAFHGVTIAKNIVLPHTVSKNKHCTTLLQISNTVTIPCYYYSTVLISTLCRFPVCRYGVECKTVDSANDIVVPAFSETSRHCVFQSDLLLFSCAGAHQTLTRICPCRDYMKGQVALCKDCL